MNSKRIGRRFAAAVVILFVIAVLLLGADRFILKNDSGDDKAAVNLQKETLIVWYTDDALTDYLNNRALAFYDETDIRVEPKLVSGLEYLENINKASIYDSETAPDVYIITNDFIEKAYLAGLASELSGDYAISEENGFNSVAVNSVTYDGKITGCPFYFETSALLYNETYLEQIAAQANELRELSEDTETAEISAQDLIPGSIADIINIADSYSVPENVEYFFRWDVSDIFYNYFFIGNYITVGGEAGDNKNDIDIYNVESVSSLKVYQELNQFFSIDMKETNYDTIMQEFLDGKTIYTIATSDCIAKLDEAAENGEFPYEYGLAKLPNINQELVTKGMSVTDALVINGYSEHKDAANRLVEFLSKTSGEDLYAMTGKISAVSRQEYQDSHISTFVENYAMSVPVPKMVETSNLWVELEICFAKVWNGEDANTQLRSLSERIKTQLAGENVSEVPLDDPEVKLIPTVEYEDMGETQAQTSE